MPRSAPAAQICALCGDHCWWSGSASWCPGCRPSMTGTARPREVWPQLSRAGEGCNVQD